MNREGCLDRGEQQEIFDLVSKCLEMSDDRVPVFLERKLGDEPVMHREALEMWQACRLSKDFLETPLIHSFLDDDFIDDDPQEIDVYRIVELLGEGGMGSVYLAEQTEPLQRPVALKIIKRGLDTREVLSRFSAEYKALAGMNHPNLACVFDAGSWNGRPYFTMEYVPGQPLSRFSKEHDLNLEEKLNLLLQACEGVSHAHRKGVIHRDLKPGNILVRILDSGPVLKIIDFGISKIIDRDWFSERSIHTEAHHFLGTPAYMSPEQVDPRTSDVDTRTDVYGLGAVLYFLLTEVPPFDPGRLSEASLMEMLEIVRDQEPLPPTERIARAGGNRTNSKKELDWITMKALARNPDHRYDSAEALAEDVRNYLTGLPVQAGPGSVWYAAGKFVKRHRVITAMAILMVVAAFFFTQSLIQQNRADARARETEKVMLVLNTSLDIINPNRMRKQEEKRDLNKMVADKLMPILEQFPQGPEILNTLARNHANLGDTQTALVYAEEALDLHCKLGGPIIAETLFLMDRKAYYLFISDKLEDAAHLFRETLALAIRHLGTDHAQFYRTLKGLADVLTKQGQIEQAIHFYEIAIEGMTYLNLEDETLITWGLLATATRSRDKRHAFNLYRNTWEGLCMELDPDHPETLNAQHNFAISHNPLKYWEKEEQLLRDVLARKVAVFGRLHPKTLLSKAMLGRNLYSQGRLEDAAALLYETQTLQKEILGEDHSQIMDTMTNYAIVLGSQGRYHESIAVWDKIQRLEKRKFGERAWRTMRARTNMADHLIRLECYAQAERMLAENLMNSKPDSFSAVVAAVTLAEALARQERWRDAEFYLSAALEPAHTHLEGYMTEIIGLLGVTQARIGQRDNAIMNLEECRRRAGGSLNDQDKLIRETYAELQAAATHKVTFP